MPNVMKLLTVTLCAEHCENPAFLMCADAVVTKSQPASECCRKNSQLSTVASTAVVV